MKEIQKYIKTRGQKNASQQNISASLAELVSTKIKKKATSSSVKEQSSQKHLPKTKQKATPKTRLITKTKSSDQKKQGSKQKKQQIVKKIKAKKVQLNQMNNVSIQLKKQVKTKQKNSKKEKKEKKDKLTKLKKYKKQTKSQLEVNGVNHFKKQKNNETSLSKSKSTQQKLNKLNLIKGQDKKQKKQQKIIKIKIQDQTKSPSKGAKIIFNQAQMNGALQQSHKALSATNILSQPQVQLKKKGRPKKIISVIKVEPISIDEQKQLEDFIENAIRLRKVKNEKQFFQCFSRITQYVRQSWEYGDLGKQIKHMPQNQDILRIGIPIVRGIRKQLLQQQLLSQTI